MKLDLRPIAAALLIVTPLTLSACGKKAADAQVTAGGEVLPGSASDAMLPLDSVRSEPPLAEPSEAGDSGKATGKAKGKAASESSESPAPTEEPSATDTAQPVSTATPEA